MNRTRSEELWQSARQVLVGGVNSPVRAFKGVGGAPFFAQSGAGPCVRDADGNELVDYVLSWGPLVLGHAHPAVVDAVCRAMASGSSFGIPTEAEILLAEKIRAHYPVMEKVRLVNSGTEATMSAVRLARGVTGRNVVVKVDGCYHGHADGLLVSAGSGVATLGLQDSPGVPAAFAGLTLTVPYNDLEAVRELFSRRGDEIACMIIEPVAGNMGVVLPEPGYLEGLRAITAAHGALLIFDEVMSGFRAALGGAQRLYGVRPDLVTLGKVIGGGLPVGAYGGPAAFMDQLAPLGAVYQAGTLAGNPLAMAAGLATLGELERPGMAEGIAARLAALAEGLGDIARATGVPVFQTRAGSMGCLFFQEGPVRSYDDAKKSDTARYAKFFWAMLDRGVYFAPSQFEACFMSAAHGDRHIDQTLDAAKQAMAAL